ncbi:hypothetical protein BKA62DRAFT_680209 [Auriculariales sp. MPI-PUGE-AT-0066]|nr:hypothetical protein BKA62DRAFT_680209 [Auriculariales sp. MPI-PUGE-AT-0066]
MAGAQPGGLAMYQVKVRNLGGARRPRAGVGYMSEHTETIGGSTETIGSNRKGTWNSSSGGTDVTPPKFAHSSVSSYSVASCNFSAVQPSASSSVTSLASTVALVLKKAEPGCAYTSRSI